MALIGGTMRSIKVKSLVVALTLMCTSLVGTQVASASASAPGVQLMQPTFTSLTQDGPATNFPAAWLAAWQVHWTVTAPAGVCGQTITWWNYSDTYPGTETDTLSKTARSFAGNDEFLGFMRGGYNAYVTVKECNGVKLTSNTLSVVLQTGDDHNAGNYGPGPLSNVPLTFSPTGWRVANCTCFVGGTSTWTTTKNASFSFVTPQPFDATGVRVALLMPEGPGRGSAAIYVDNKYYKTISTYHAGSNVNGVVNYQFLLTGPQMHIVRVVNLATAGHPRIDIDAVIN